MKRKAIALFSGGLDSILACQLIARQNIEVVAVKFISPFFDYDLLAEEADYRQKVREKFGIDVVLRDISLEYIAMVRAPQHGYGKHFNPCLDCKIFMMTKARELLEDYNASFLISGEVVGQRPMSQRRDALRVVEKYSGCDGLLLRPLCAKNLESTVPEIKGLVDRQQLCDFSGRSRCGQIALAREYGIQEYPTPAGGCILTDPLVGERIKSFYGAHQHITIADMRLIQVGRQFLLPGGGWLVMGRKESENVVIEGLVQEGDFQLNLLERPGPTALLRYAQGGDDLQLAAGLVARYGKKDNRKLPQPGKVSCVGPAGVETLTGLPPADALSRPWLY